MYLLPPYFLYRLIKDTLLRGRNLVRLSKFTPDGHFRFGHLLRSLRLTFWISSDWIIWQFNTFDLVVGIAIVAGIIVVVFDEWCCIVLRICRSNIGWLLIDVFQE